MSPMLTGRGALALLLLAAMPALAVAQAGSDVGGREPPRLSFGLSGGITMPTAVYDQWIEGELRFPDGGGVATERITTRYVERSQAAPLVRATLRFRPFSPMAIYFAYQHSEGRTESTYLGGAAQETFIRTLRIQTGEFGLQMRLVRWAQGAGLVDYKLGAAMVRHTLDLSAGHRDRFASWRGEGPPADLEWTERSWTSVSFAGGVGARVPIGENLGVRLGVNVLLVPFNSSQMEREESREIGRVMHPPPSFQFPRFTAVYGGARLGLDYYLTGERPRPMGWVRSLLHRAGDAQPLTLPDLSVRADTAGTVSLAWSIANLGDAGYEVTVEIVGEDGEPVPIMEDDADAHLDLLLRLERPAPIDGNATERIELWMLDARPGAFAVRVQVRDSATGERVERTAGFEIR